MRESSEWEEWDWSSDDYISNKREYPEDWEDYVDEL